MLAIAGLTIAFFVAPTDAQQGEAYRIIFIHVPAAWMSMFIYLVMAGWAGFGQNRLIFHILFFLLQCKKDLKDFINT